MSSSLLANQLSIPFRRSTHLALSKPLCRYVTDKYGQHPDVFRQDLEVVDTLRRDAVNVHEAHASGIKKLQAYAAQLAWIAGKFPVEIGAEFTWYPALGYNTDRPVVHDSLQFEIVNVLYNLAALYCQLAAATSHSDMEGLKTAASYYAQAAGVLQHLRAKTAPASMHAAMPNSIPFLSETSSFPAGDLSALLPDDFDAATLESLEHLMLAQAQECFWLRAVSEAYKDATISKLAAHVSDLYNLAGEAAVRSDAISRAWIHHMSAKQHHFAAAAQYRASLDCLEKRRYGEEIARLQDALNCATEGMKEAKGGSGSGTGGSGSQVRRSVLDDLQSLKRRVEEDLKRAEKDNDMIYLNVVPAKSELKILDRAKMAVARVPAQVEKPFDFLGDGAEFGPALFAKLVPFAVHLAISVYEERRDRLVNQNIINDLEALTEQLHEALLTLNLPGSLQAIERPLGLPGTLKQHAEEVRYADVLNRVPRSFADIDKLRAADEAVFNEGRALLEVEQDEDAQLRGMYGDARWARPASQGDVQGQKLWTTASEIAGYLESSGASDGLVRNMFASVHDMLALLAGPDRALLDFVPNSRAVGGEGVAADGVKPALGRLRGAYNDVLRVESRRRRRVEALHDKARSDDIKADILRETARLERTQPQTTIAAVHFDGFFATRLRDRYHEDQEMVTRERAEQERMLEDVRRASREFEAQKRRMSASGGSGGGHSREREAALQTLDTAYYKYKEIVKNVEVARKFYNDLSKISGSFRDQCRGWVQQRRIEAQSLEEDLSMPVLSSLSLGHSSPSGMATAQVAPQAWTSGPLPPSASASVVSTVSGVSAVSASPLAPSHAPPLPQQQSALPIPPIQQQQQQQQQQQTWSPNMGIQFGAPANRTVGSLPHASSSNTAASQAASNSRQQSSGTWDPSSGIRFG